MTKISTKILSKQRKQEVLTAAVDIHNASDNSGGVHLWYRGLLPEQMVAAYLGLPPPDMRVLDRSKANNKNVAANRLGFDLPTINTEVKTHSSNSSRWFLRPSDKLVWQKWSKKTKEHLANGFVLFNRWVENPSPYCDCDTELEILGIVSASFLKPFIHFDKYFTEYDRYYIDENVVFAMINEYDTFCPPKS
jgi:hypothetical protein